MNNVFNIREDDILWKYYCKRFAIEGKEVEAPKNFCRYFWTAIHGFGLWLGREASLKKLWLLNFIFIPIIIIANWLFLKVHNNIFTAILGIALGVIWGTIFAAASIVSTHRLIRIIEKKAPWAILLFGLLLFGGIIVHTIIIGTFWSELHKFYIDIGPFIGYTLIASVVFAVLMIIASYLGNKTSFNTRWQKLKRLFQAFEAFIKTKTSKVKTCPDVNPPVGFSEKK